MNDLRKAAEMALETLETTWGNGSEGTLKQWEETIQALRKALNVDAVNMSQESVDETAKSEHKWVGLTDEEVDEIYMHEGQEDVVLLTQAKLREKNT